MTTSIPCTVCGQPTKPDPFFYEWKHRRFIIRRCVDCTHQFVHPPVTSEDQSEIYGDNYFSRDGDWVCGLFAAGYIESEQLLRAEAREVLSMLPVSSGRLLDVGCAGGVFLDEARRRGFSVAGIELNASMADHARSNYGLDVRTSPIEELPVSAWAERFDVITILDCLEHIPEPRAAMSKVASWLNPGGHVVIRGPLSDSRLARVRESVRRMLGIQKHLPGYPLDANMFNRRSLKRLLDEVGFAPPVWIRATSNFANVLSQKR